MQFPWTCTCGHYYGGNQFERAGWDIEKALLIINAGRHLTSQKIEFGRGGKFVLTLMLYWSSTIHSFGSVRPFYRGPLQNCCARQWLARFFLRLLFQNIDCLWETGVVAGAGVALAASCAEAH